MELQHEHGCDERHGSRQRCNVPRTREVPELPAPRAPARLAERRPRPVASSATKSIALRLEAVPLAAGLTLPAFVYVSISDIYATGSLSWLSVLSGAAVLAGLLAFTIAGLGWIMVGRTGAGLLLLLYRVPATFFAFWFAFAFLWHAADGVVTFWLIALYAGSILSSVVSVVLLHNLVRVGDCDGRETELPEDPGGEQDRALRMAFCIEVVPAAVVIVNTALVLTAGFWVEGPDPWFGVFTLVAILITPLFFLAGVGWFALGSNLGCIVGILSRAIFAFAALAALSLAFHIECPGGGDDCMGSGQTYPYGFEGTALLLAVGVTAIIWSVVSALRLAETRHQRGGGAS